MLQNDGRHCTVRAGAIVALIATTLFAAPADAGSVAYRTQFVNGFGCHIVQVNLNNPRVKVTPILSLRFPGGAESMATMCSREQPAAAVTGTFFSKTTLLPIGDIVVDGRLIYFGGMGSAIAITPDNRVFFRRIPYGRRQDWGAFESVLACGPMLLERSRVALAPVHERFGDPHVLGRAMRTAVGLTEQNRLLLMATREQMSLWELAKVMRGLGCIDAINLDGGSSTGMYYRGSAKISPGRGLVNMLAVYEDVPSETRTCGCESPEERDAIASYRAAKAYRVYMQAQVPLATGELEEAVRLLDRAAELDPRNASYQVRLAETLARQDEEDAAAVAWARAGEILLEKKHYRGALERFESALAIDPDSGPAWRGLPEAYRGLGMVKRAEAVEYHLTLRELRENIVAAHPELMVDLVTDAFALRREPIPDTVPGPLLDEVVSERSYVDPEQGVRLYLPPRWEFAARDDPSTLAMHHRYRPWLAHLRGVWTPKGAALEQLVELYWERSFQHSVYHTPIMMGTPSRGTWVTETISTTGDISCATEFILCEDVLWILSMTAASAEMEEARADFERLVEGLTLFKASAGDAIR